MATIHPCAISSRESDNMGAETMPISATPDLARWIYELQPLEEIPIDAIGALAVAVITTALRDALGPELTANHLNKTGQYYQRPINGRAWLEETWQVEGDWVCTFQWWSGTFGLNAEAVWERVQNDAAGKPPHRHIPAGRDTRRSGTAWRCRSWRG